MKFITEFEGPWARTDSWMLLPVSGWRRQRPKTLVDRCSQCGWCCLYCPSGCVTQLADHFAADLNYCKGCGLCARECPAQAIVMIEEKEV
ncbi:MAG: 4Fe-4S binding protein [Pseudomonadota bacterium]